MKKTTKFTKQKKNLKNEQSFIKLSTNLLMMTVLIFAVVFAYKNTFGTIDLNNTNTDTETSISALINKVDTSLLISNQLSDIDKPQLIEKIKQSELDILSNNEFDYNKYISDNINIKKDIELTANEVGLLYSYLFVDFPDKYNTILYEISITKTDTATTIKTVASISLYNLFTSKISDNESFSSLPKRIYVTNIATYKNNQYS